MVNTISKHKHGITVQLDVFLLEDEDKIYVAFCPALNLSSYGNTLNDAKKAFDEVVSIFVEETTKKGTLEKVLLKLGWTLKALPKPIFEPPKLSTQFMQQMVNGGAHVNSTKVSIPATYC